MKILFLDIDGVVNSKHTAARNGGIAGIDPYLAFLVGKISLAVEDLKVVLSSSWRHFPNGRTEVEQHVLPIYDQTPNLRGESRGKEIQAWLDEHPEVECYAILDDEGDMLESQQAHFFRTSWDEGITPEISERVIAHLT